MKIEIWKSESSKQYTATDGRLNLSICNGGWRGRHGVSKQHGVMLFYGGAFDSISRKFAAALLRQFRRDVRLMKGRDA
jgi:hypothetical protein